MSQERRAPGRELVTKAPDAFVEAPRRARQGWGFLSHSSPMPPASVDTGDNPFDRGDWATRSKRVGAGLPGCDVPEASTRVTGRPIHSVCGWLPRLLRRRLYAVPEVQTELQPSPLERWPWR
jgi:hypothetical protein